MTKHITLRCIAITQLALLVSSFGIFAGTSSATKPTTQQSETPKPIDAALTIALNCVKEHMGKYLDQVSYDDFARGEDKWILAAHTGDGRIAGSHFGVVVPDAGPPKFLPGY